MAFAAGRIAIIDKQLLVLASMGGMAGVALSGNERTVQVRQAQVLADNLMAIGAQRPLGLGQHPVKDRFVRQVTSQALPVTDRLMVDLLPLLLFRVAIQTESVG
jgi:hypothetical protein